MSRARQPVTIDGIAFDALLDEIPKLPADIPVYPTEEGFEISDSIILKAKELSMTLFLTNTPVTWRRRNGSGSFRVNDVIDELEAMYFSKKPVTVRTSDKTYNNMGVLQIEIPKKRETGSSREVHIAFREIRTTEQSTATIPASYGKSGSTGANAGTTTSTPGAAPAGSGGNTTSGGSNSSILFSAAGSAGLLGG